MSRPADLAVWEWGALPAGSVVDTARISGFWSYGLGYVSGRCAAYFQATGLPEVSLTVAQAFSTAPTTASGMGT